MCAAARQLLITGILIHFSYAIIAAQEQSLFDGQTLRGWQVKPSEARHWQVQDEQIVAENSDQQGSVLWTKKAYRDFALELEYRTPSADYDSGVFLRGESHQVQIGISYSLKVDLTGCIYAPSDNRGKYPAKSDKVTEVQRVGEWNHLRVIVKDNRIQTFLNKVPLVDYKAATMPDKGAVGLQLHAGLHMKMFFRNIRLSEF